MKFMHTMGAIGLMGAMACLLVLSNFLPPPTPLRECALMRAAMGGIAAWIFLPSLALTLIAGLLAMAVNRALALPPISRSI
jgi:membrane-bound ClpP family serine protease